MNINNLNNMLKAKNSGTFLGVKKLILQYCVVLCMVVSTGNGCPTDCQRCSDSVVQCQNIGLNEIPQNLPTDSITVDLSRNEVTNVARQSFQVLPSVLSLRMLDNKINHIQSLAFATLSNLMTLDLTSNELRTLNNRALQGLTHLSTLSLSQNQLQTLGRALAKTPSITSLNARSNQLSVIDQQTFERNTELRQLDLSNNQITSIHGRAFANLRKLRYLIMNNNPLVHLPQLVFPGAMLQLVDFSNCQLNRVPRIMPPSVRDFRLGANHIEQIADTDLQNITNLKLLTLNNNRISSFAYRALRGLENLEELWLSTNQLVYIPRGLPATLKKLNQEFNLVTELEDRLFSTDSRLESLTLENNNIETVNEGALNGLAWLKQINLQGNAISELRMNTFKDLPLLEEIYISNNPISTVHPGSFQSLPNLTALSMSYIDTISVTIGSDFLTGIQNVKILEFLNSPAFVGSLIELISQQQNQPVLSALEHINLQYNDLETLPESFKRIVQNAREVLLDGNIWHCDRSLIWFKRWLTTSATSFFRNEAPTCESPRHLGGQLITSLSNGQFVHITNPIAHQSRSSSGAFNGGIADQPIAELRSLDLKKKSKPTYSIMDKSKTLAKSNTDSQLESKSIQKEKITYSEITAPTKQPLSTVTTTNNLDDLDGLQTQKLARRRKRKNRKNRKNRRHRKRSTDKKKKRRCKKDKDGKKKCRKRRTKKVRKSSS